MTEKLTFTIDGESFSTLEEFYDEVSRKLIPEATWGRNLDAFNDILRGGFGTPEDGFVLVWRSSDFSRDRLGYRETIRQLECRLQRCHSSNCAQIRTQLGLAYRSEGPTVFDWLTCIISACQKIDIYLNPKINGDSRLRRISMSGSLCRNFLPNPPIVSNLRTTDINETDTDTAARTR